MRSTGLVLLGRFHGHFPLGSQTSRVTLVDMRWMSIASVLIFALVSSVFADPAPIDPHLIAATGGDATLIGTDGLIVTLSPDGGGIFSFQNNTGMDLAAIDITIPFLSPISLNVQTVPAGALSGFTESFPVTCPAGEPTSAPCLTLGLTLAPGTGLGAEGAPFVLDFNGPPFSTDDQDVLGGHSDLGNLNGSDQVGGWIPGAKVFVVPVLATPEPGNMIVLLLAGASMAIYSRRRSLRLQ
jgi:hypothetical protein